jgi:hypothetical protein
MDYRDAKIALVNEKTIPHSFGRYIFVNREDYINGRIADEIIAHEWTHVQQRHTWDIMFIELLIAFGWFNPVFYLYRSKIRQNHEFLADGAVICRNEELIPVYQTILINFISKNRNINFASNFNFNFLNTQKRIVMMTKTTSNKRAWCISVALIPVLIAAIFVFSTKTIAQNNLNTLPEQTTDSVENPVIDNDRMITCGEGVSQDLLTEYQEIVGKYLEKKTKGNLNESVRLYWKSDYLSEEDWTRLYVIYVQMTVEQQKEQKITFYGGPTSGGPYPPNQRRYDQWKKDNKCTIWIDDENVGNSILNSYKRTDFDAYFESGLLRSENRDLYRVDLWTKNGFKKLRQELFEQPVSIGKLLEIEPCVKFLMEKYTDKRIDLCRYPTDEWRLLTTMEPTSKDGIVIAVMATTESTPLTYHQN